MTAPIRPTASQKEDPADLWDRLVRAGMKPDSATKYVAKRNGDPPRRPVAAASDATATDRKEPRKNRTLGEDINGALDSAQQGLTLGFGDEAAALAVGLVSNPMHPLENFEERRKLADKAHREFAEAHPVGDIAMQVVGGLGGPMIERAALKAAGIVPRAVAAMAEGSRAARAAKEVGRTAALGGVYGAGSAEGGVADRAKGAAAGATIGALLHGGAKAGAAAGEATGITRGVKNLLPRSPVEDPERGTLMQRFAPRSHEELAADEILRDIEQSGLSVDEHIARAKANPGSTLYDLGPSLPAKPGAALLKTNADGDPLVRRARGVQSMPSKGSTQISQAINQRAESRGKDVVDALRSGLETPRENVAALDASARGDFAKQNPDDAVTLLRKGLGAQRENVETLGESLKSARSDAAKPLYEKAYAAAAIDDPDVIATMSLPAFRRAHEIGRRIAKLEGVDLPPLARDVMVDGQPVRDVVGGRLTEQVPQSVQAIDYTKRGLDDYIEARTRAGKMGRTEARILRQRLADMLGRVDKAAPDYAAARQAFGSASKEIEAADLGTDFWKTTGDQLEVAWPKLSDAAKAEYRKTALAAIEESLGGGAKPDRLLNPVNSRKLGIIFPDAQSHRAFEEALGRQVAGPAADPMVKALDMGQHFWSGTGDELELAWPRLGEPERVQYRKGALAAIEEALAGRGDPAKLYDQLSGRKLALVFPTPEKYEQFEMAVRRAVQQRTNDAVITGGSPTARIHADQANLGANPAAALSALGQASAGHPGGLIARAAKSAADGQQRVATEGMADALAPFLTAKGDDLAAKLERAKAVKLRIDTEAQLKRLRSSRLAALAGANASTQMRRP